MKFEPGLTRGRGRGLHSSRWQTQGQARYRFFLFITYIKGIIVLLFSKNQFSVKPFHYAFVLLQKSAMNDFQPNELY